MHNTAILFLEFGAVVLGLGILGALALRVGISPIPLYLIAGLAFAPVASSRWPPARTSSPPAPN